MTFFTRHPTRALGGRGEEETAMSSQEEAADYCARMYQVRGAVCVAWRPRPVARAAPGVPAPAPAVDQGP